MTPVSSKKQDPLSSPRHLFLVVLAVIFSAEWLVMMILPSEAARTTRLLWGALDSAMLTTLSSPFLWWFIVRPLRSQAMGERVRAATVVTNATEGILTLDSSGRITSINPAGEEMFRISAPEAEGRDWTTLFPPSAGSGTPAAPDLTLEHASNPVGMDTVLQRTDRTTFEAELALYPLPHERGRAFACMVRDISLRKRAERQVRESRNMLKLVLDAIPVRVFWKDSNLNYLGCNGRFAEDAGLARPEHVVGLDDTQMAWKDLAEGYRADDRQVIASGAARLEYEEPLTDNEGGRHWLQTSKVPLTDADGHIIGVMGCYTDITARKRAEDALEALAKTSPLTDLDNFFRTGAIHLAKAFDARVASVSLLEDDERIATRALWIDGQIVDNIDYRLAGTPCAEVISRGPRLYPEGLAQTFPDDAMLADLKLESYFGMPLVTSGGETLGLVSVMDDRPMTPSPQMASVLGSFAQRMAAEVERHRAEERERTSRAELAAILDNMQDTYFRADLEGIIAWTSPSSRELVGYSPREMAGQSLGLLCGERDKLNNFLALIRDTQGRVSNLPVELGRKDGTRVWAAINANFVRDAEGNAVGIEGTMRDIQALKEVQETLSHTLEELEDRVRERTAELARFKRTLDATRDCVFMFDPDTLRFIYVNQGATDQVGYSAEELSRMTPLDIKPEHDESRFRAMLASLIAGERNLLHFETEHRRKDGALIPVAVSLQYVVLEGEPPRFVATARDIAERRRAERELIAARDQAEAANRAKSEFLSRMSHELRTPLNAMLGFGQLLGSTPDNPLSPNQRHYVDEINQAGSHLLSLVNEVLDLSRIEAGTLNLSIGPVAVAPVAEECIALLAGDAGKRHISIDNRIRPACHLLADPTRLREVLINLLSNAVKYNKEGGSVTLRCASGRDGRVTITIADTGPGISKSLQQRLFEPFDRLGWEHSAVEGTGIGLSITRKLVLAMGGELELTSRRGHGSSFRVRFPMAKKSAAPRPARIPEKTRGTISKRSRKATEKGATPARRTVLYVEDNRANILLMEEMFRRRDDLVLITESCGLSGVETAHRKVPDLILLDINLPDIDGFQVLERLREDKITRAIPVVGVSANSFPQDRARALSAGFTDYVTKPFSLQRLYEALDQVLIGHP